MNDSKSSFEYDSVVSDDDDYTGVVDGVGGTPDTNPRRHGANLLTPSTVPADTPRSSGAGGYDYEDLEFSQLASNAPSQVGLQSGMFNSSTAAADFNERLKETVEFSKKWSAIDNQQRDEEHVFEDESAYEIGSGHTGGASGMAPVDDTTFDLSSINQSSGSMVDSAMDRDPSAIPMPVREMEERRPTRVADQAASGRNNLHVDLGNPQAPRPALRGSRTATPGQPGYYPDSPAPGSVQHSVLFAPSRSSAAHTEHEETDESIMFREQESLIEQTRPPWESSSRSQSRGGDDTAELSAPISRQRNISPMLHLPLSPAKLNMDATSGVGLAGGVFRRFAGWAQNQLQLSPNPVASSLQPATDQHDKDLDVSDDSDGSDSAEQRTPVVRANSRNRAASNPNATPSSNASSALTTSSASPMGTEPMRSNVLSNFTTTPTSARTGSARQTPLHVTTPRRTPRSSRRLSFTPSRSVNPLARHLAINAIQSVPSGGANQNEAMPGSMDTTPTNRGINGSLRMLYSSPGDPSFSENVSMASSMGIDMESLKRDIDNFVQMAKDSELNIHEDVRETQEAWIRMQQELADLHQQLIKAETDRDYLHDQVQQAELERAEWESERQNLIDDKADLMTNIDVWRRRIGDVESDRQGVWREGVQSSEKLLLELTNLEKQLHESRREARDIKGRLDRMSIERNQHVAGLSGAANAIASLEDENDRLHMKCEQLAEENRDIQTESYKAKVRIKEISDEARKIDSELQRFKNMNELLDAKIIEQEEEIRIAKIRESRLAAEALQNRESREQMQRQIDDEHGQGNSDVSDNAKLIQEVEQLREGNQLLQEALEDLTDQNRKLKAAAADAERLDIVAADTTSTCQPVTHEQEAMPLDSDSIAAAISDARAEAMAEASREIERLRSRFENDLAGATSDQELLRNQLSDLVEQNGELKQEIARLTKDTEKLLKENDVYKKDNHKYMSLAEVARARVESAEAQLKDLEARYGAVESQETVGNSSSDAVVAESDEIAQLRESEDQLRRELDSAERDREGLSERVRSLEARNKQLSTRNDDLSQRTARLESEIGELRQMQTRAQEDLGVDSELANVEGTGPDRIHELQDEVSRLQTELADLRHDLALRKESIDRMRHEASDRDALVDDLHAKLSEITKELESERNALKSAQDALTEARLSSSPTANTSAATSPKLGHPSSQAVNEASLKQTLNQTIADVSDLEKSCDRMVERRSKLEREQRFLADQLRDTLINNATLRSELAELVLRSDGRLREVRERRTQLGSQYSDTSVYSDDGNNSTMSGRINLVPNVSQLIDGSGAKYMQSLDKHLDAMAHIIDSEENDSDNVSPDQRIKQLMSSPLKRSRSLQAAVGSSARMQRKVLTPIKEEFTSHSLVMLREASVECNIIDEDLLKTVQNLERELEQAHDQEFHMKTELDALRQTVANIRHERDQFNVSYEKAEERASQLSAQVEDLTGDHERMKAINITAARVSIRVSRQIAVLKGALTRLAVRDSTQTNGSGSASAGGPLSNDNSPLTPLEADENQIALEEDDAFRQAAIDHPLDSNGNDNSELGLKSGEVLEQVGAGIHEAYEHIKRLRADIQRSKRERAHLMKRLGEFEHAKLPSYQLSSEWSRSMRHRSYTESLVRGQGDSNLTQLLTAVVEAAEAESWKNGDDDGSSAGDNGSDRLIMDMEPPASLFLTDESEVAAGIAALDRKAKAKASNERSATILLPDGTKINKAVLSDRIAALAEIVRLKGKLKKKSLQLLNIEQECSKLESLNNKSIETYDRLYGEYTELKGQVSSMIKAGARSAGLTMTPVNGTNWDDIASIEREMERCKAQSVAYMTDVEKLCQVLNQHTIDQALASDSAGVDPADIEGSILRGSKKGRSIRYQPAKAANVYRTLLIDMADVLNARGDLDDRKSIRDNFSNMAAAIGQRLDDKDRLIEDLQADLEDARKARLSASKSSDEQQLRSANARIAILEKQLSIVQDKLRNADDMLDSTGSELQKSRAAFSKRSGECIKLQNQLQKATARADREARRTHDLEADLTKSNSQLKIYNWACQIWEDVVRTFVKDSIQLVNATPDGSGDEIRTLVTSLSQDTNELDYIIKHALEKTKRVRSVSRPDSDDSFEALPAQRSVSGRLDGIFQELKGASTTRLCESICSGISRIASMILAARPGDYQYGLDGRDGTGLLRSVNGHHELDPAQQALIRQDYTNEIQELKRSVDDYKQRLAIARRKNDALDYESQYRKERLTIEHNRTRALTSQVGTLMNFIGGPKGLSDLIDKRVEQKRLSRASEPFYEEDNRPRRLWRRALWVVRMIRVLQSLEKERKDAYALKEKGVKLTRELNPQLNGHPGDHYHQRQPQQRQLQYQRVPQYSGMRAVPITPSRLRNCASDMISSNGSSPEF
ncbi:hypothetical protein GGI15_000282 [Coemansia interrupta]|uniref:Uncharacterized protein n=1 Tax=Coemansia interrupta TaxID=1126814 RepID=A0A9W8HKJ8_9FUNG|nr:hypothetical protein GGI15_000282 [Coemansia interrupta]